MATITFTLPISANCRSISTLVPNFSIYANVSPTFWNDKIETHIERTEKDQINNSDWSHEDTYGIPFYYRRQNAFHDQELYNRKTRAFVMRQGTFFKYYTTTYNTSSDPLFKEDNNRSIDRFFDLVALVTFSPQDELYARFGIQYTTQYEVFVHMGLFLEYNYASLKRDGIKPACSENEHNPVWYQRGYEKFVYHGYTADQIFPKAGDMCKMEFDNVLFKVTKVQDNLPDFQYKWRKYWWKLYLNNSVDNSTNVNSDVLNHPEQEKFINNLMGNMIENGTTDDTSNAWVFDVSNTVNTLKKDVLFKPEEVASCVTDITNDPSYYACPSLLGQW